MKRGADWHEQMPMRTADSPPPQFRRQMERGLNRMSLDIANTAFRRFTV